ncbi:hypothetical protein CesoFtcFv8_000318, partial [Champsocephalus esox]
VLSAAVLVHPVPPGSHLWPAPLRPLWVEFPTERSAFSADHQFMIGGALLACPVTEAQVKEVNVLLPDLTRFGSTCTLQRSLKEEGLWLFLSLWTQSLSAALSITVAPNPQGLADGELYLDDGHSFRFRDRKSFSRRRFSFLSDRLICRAAGEGETFECDTVVQTLTVLGLKRKPSSVIVHVNGEEI